MDASDPTGKAVYVPKNGMVGKVIQVEVRRDKKVELHIELDQGGKVTALLDQVEVLPD